MMTNPRIAIYMFPLLILLAIQTNAQIKIKLSGEGGYFSNQNSFSKNDDHLEARLDGKLSYNYKSANRTASVDLRARPEIFGFTNSLTSLKLKAAGYYKINQPRSIWNFNITGITSSYTYSSVDTRINSFSLSTNYSFVIDSKNFLSSQIGYSFRTHNENSSLDIDLVFINGLWIYNLMPQTSIGAGIYLEKFTSSFDPGDRTTSVTLKNRGFRFGPEFNFDFTGGIIFKGSYMFLFHNSDVTSKLSSEHLVKLVAGKSLSKKITLMFLIEYYFGDLNFAEDTNSDKYLYFPSNNENEIYSKLSFDASSSTEFYLRAGYFNINLKIDEQSLTGWNTLAGIQISL